MESSAIFAKVVRDLNEAGQPFALVGAIAVAVRAVELSTKDIDFAVAVPDETAALALLTRLERNDEYTVTRRIRDSHTDELCSAALLVRGSGGIHAVVDLLFDTCGIEREVVAAAEPVEVLPDVRVDVATRGHLIAMKVLSLDDGRRPKDRVHLADLLQSSSELDIEEARDALCLMEERDVGKRAAKDDLQAELDQAIQLYGPELEPELEM